MNTNRLSRLYHCLPVWERIPWFVAAHARRDEAEYRHLFVASPPRTWQRSAYLLAEQALYVLALIHVTEQLAAVNDFFTRRRLEDTDDLRPEDGVRAVEASASFFAANADARRRFRAGLGLAPVALTAADDHGWFLQYRAEKMPANAPTAEALLTRLRQTGRDDARRVPADALLASWRSLLRAMTRHAPCGVGEGER